MGRKPLSELKGTKMIVKKIDIYDFRNEFVNLKLDKCFSDLGLNILFEALQEFSDFNKKPMMLNVVDLCSKFIELSVEDVLAYYPESNEWESIQEYLSEYTWLCGSWWDGDVKYFVFQEF